VFLVSHDRAFVDNVATSIVAWEGDESPGQWREYEGSVQDWMTQRDRAQRLRAASAPPSESGKNTKSDDSPRYLLNSSLLNNEHLVSPPAAVTSAKPKKLSYKEQRELDTLPAKIAALEAEQKNIARDLNSGQLYVSDPVRATALAQRTAAIDDELLQCLERQEALS
jgi:ABC transport system ATP-binding/permease protein